MMNNFLKQHLLLLLTNLQLQELQLPNHPIPHQNQPTLYHNLPLPQNLLINLPTNPLLPLLTTKLQEVLDSTINSAVISEVNLTNEYEQAM